MAKFQQFGTFPLYELGTTWKKSFGSLHWNVQKQTCQNSFSILYEGIASCWKNEKTDKILFLLIEDQDSDRYLGLSLENSYSMVCNCDVQKTSNQFIYVRWLETGSSRIVDVKATPTYNSQIDNYSMWTYR